MKIEYNKHRVEYMLSLFKMTAGELLSSINKGLKTPITWDDIDSDEIELNYLKRIDKVFNKGLLYYYDPSVPVKDKKVSVFFRKESFTSELNIGSRKRVREFEDLKTQMLLSGKYDSKDAILSIHSGTGGVDANDWAMMLERMYLRYCEKKGFKTKILDRQDDVDYGIKSSTILVQGDNAYGMLKSETGVHRLVRISPFNAMGKRQTSFAAVEVVPDIGDDIEVNINPQDLKIDTYRSGGAGGQHVNTTDSAVRITHIPTGIVVTCQNERSQIMNREVAMKILVSKLTRIAEEVHKENLNEIKGDQSMATWGSQIRNYVFQPYTLVKDTRTGAEVGNVDAVMDGDIDVFVRAKLSQDAAQSIKQ